MAREPEGRAPELPHLRREVIVIDYDTGNPIAHTLHLYRTRRVDTVDELVMARRETKREVQDLLLEAMKRRG